VLKYEFKREGGTMQEEQIVLDKTFKFIVEIETTKRNIRTMLNRAVGETFGNDVYFRVGKVKVE